MLQDLFDGCPKTHIMLALQDFSIHQKIQDHIT